MIPYVHPTLFTKELVRWSADISPGALISTSDNRRVSGTIPQNNVAQLRPTKHFGGSLGSIEKLYVEIKCETIGDNYCGIAFSELGRLITEDAGVRNEIAYLNSGQVKINNNVVNTYATWTTNDVIGVAINMTASTTRVWFAKNNVWNGDPAAGTSPALNSNPGFDLDYTIAAIMKGNTQPPTFFLNTPSVYTPPAGFLPW